MAGSGDMLAAVVETGASLTRIGAIEIEPSAFAQCDERLSRIAPDSTHVISEHGNAFDPATWQDLQKAPWDLVITNPPYVRYQRSTEASSGDLDVPSASAVRAGLGDVIGRLDYLDPEYRAALQDITKAYSGLADLAVPSWILCAALVKPGGTLAMLVPDTWLSREYATPLAALLDRFFDVECVVHDADAAWFTDATVRTTLFVARRLEGGAESGARASNALHVRVDHRAASEDSLVGGAFPDSMTPEAAFAEAVRTWRMTGTGPELPGCQVELPDRDKPASNSDSTARGPGLPSQLRSIVASASMPAMMTLEDLGWRVGQGLRTGANVFFYGSAEGGSAEHELFRVDRKVGGGVVPVTRELALPVVRSQVDLPAGAVINPAAVPGRVLALHGHVRAQDRQGQSPEEDRALAGYEILPKDLADHLTYVESLNLGSDEHGRFVPNLSAVRPNTRRFDTARPDVAPRFWYQLPSFAPRHRPDLCIARVNYRHPRVVLNPGREVLIDANFSTLWRDNNKGLDPLAMLALLTSTWAQASMELIGTVLGGGALKVEAAQLRRLLVPPVVREIEGRLMETGRMLVEGADTTETQAAIDDVVSALLGLDRDGSIAVAHVAEQRLGARTR